MKLRRLLKEGFKSPVTLIMMSHLSDISESSSKENRNKAEFVKFLMNKYINERQQIDPDAEWSEFMEKYGRK